MKHFILLLFIFCASLFKSFAQDIIYGSNSGKYVEIKNKKIYYEEYGSGPNVLLLHGGFGSIYDFQNVISDLSVHFRIVAVDSPGHGRSEQADTMSFDLMANYMTEFIEKLGLKQTHIIGYSDGGIVSILIASRRPDIVDRVIASGINTKRNGIKPEVLTYLDQLTPEFIESNQQRWLENYKSISPQPNKWKKFVNDMSEMYSPQTYIDSLVLSDVESNVLLVYGDRDVIELEHGLAIHRSLKASSFCILPETPHEVFRDNPKLISQISKDFILKK